MVPETVALGGGVVGSLVHIATARIKHKTGSGMDILLYLKLFTITNRALPIVNRQPVGRTLQHGLTGYNYWGLYGHP